ncbi:class I SAM-dependent methyltransferase [Oceanobacillus damuensis]|uniref:class I SAM-dependent methyltransferase n=1 Tax=Oceanobacillus damuensis TaxID=937928 RepID=UPI0008322F6E|nr:class I SAM-dependent methyltransferase [Oceanobacillus damuensis]
MLAACKRKHPEIEIRKGHFLALPLMDNSVDGIVSSYALHHLPGEEKLLALEGMDRVQRLNGQICLADLMFADEDHRNSVIQNYRNQGNMEAVVSIEDEYYADGGLLVNWLTKKNYMVETHQFIDILSMIYAKK